MSLSVTFARVKEAAGIRTDDYDDAISAVITEQVPAIEYAIKPEHVAATSVVGLQATLNLGALEITVGCLLAELCRLPGFADVLQLASLRLEPSWSGPSHDPSGMASQGWARLRPYLRVDPAMPAAAAVTSASGKREAPE